MSRDRVVSVDAMGGDHAPEIEIAGLDQSLIRNPDTRFLLFGDEAQLKPLVDGYPRVKAASELRHTPERVAMDAKPSQVVRRGQNTSMGLAINAVKTGEASSVISAGNTGALMAMAKLQLRMLGDISRPAIAAIWPTARGESVVLDVGANVDSDARDLVHFAIMGEAYARTVLGVQKPSVALLNVGSEALKGTASVREADDLLRQLDLGLDYRGYVEGNDIGAGAVDVVVTDGFTGNVALKTAEGTARQIGDYLRAAMSRSFFSRLGYLIASGAFATLRVRLDPRRVNGGVFLGLNGVVVKSHGGTDALGFASALDLAIDMGRSTFTRDIEAATAGLGASLKGKPGGGPSHEGDSTP